MATSTQRQCISVLECEYSPKVLSLKKMNEDNRKTIAKSCVFDKSPSICEMEHQMLALWLRIHFAEPNVCNIALSKTTSESKTQNKQIQSMFCLKGLENYRCFSFCCCYCWNRLFLDNQGLNSIHFEMIRIPIKMLINKKTTTLKHFVPFSMCSYCLDLLSRVIRIRNHIHSLSFS